MDRRIFHIQNHLEQTLHKSWSVEEMADEVRMSVPQFRRLFKECVGSSPVVFLNDLRLTRAAELLSDPACFLQIKEIGLQVGVCNTSHFTQAFKTRYGMAPKEFREHQAAIHQSNPTEE